MRFVGGAGLMALGVCGARAQLLPTGSETQQLVLPKDEETLPTFEVSTVRVSAEDNPMMRFMWGADRCTIDNLTLRSILVQAYGAVSQDQIVGGPDRLMSTHFDIQAKAEAHDAAQMKDLSVDDRNRESHLMLQSLLAERFHLKVHIETREMAVYALVVAKGGAKLKASAPAPAGVSEGGARDPTGPDQLPKTPLRGGSTIRMTSTHIEASATDGTIEQLANILTNQPDAGGRMVIDRTGLAGKYDWKLTWAPNMGLRGADNGAGPDAAPGLFTALEEQLGLKLETEKGPVQVVVVDHVETPSPN